MTAKPSRSYTELRPRFCHGLQLFGLAQKGEKANNYLMAPGTPKELQQV